MSEVKILAASRNLKCRFCEFDDDDQERLTTLGEGEIRDPLHDVVYDEATNTIRDATIYTRYAYVECPNHRCTRFYVPKKECLSLEDLLVRTEDEDNEFVMQYPKGKSLNINNMVEYGTVMCSECGCFNPDNLSERQIRLVYSKVDWQPVIEITCKCELEFPCSTIYPLPPKGTHIEHFVLIKESRLLKELGYTAEPFSSLKTFHIEEDEEDKIFREALVELFGLNDPERFKANQIRTMLIKLGYRNPKIILANRTTPLRSSIKFV